MKVNRKHFIHIKPIVDLTPSEQLKDCLIKLNEKLKLLGVDKSNILKQSIFIKAENNNDYYDKKAELKSIIEDFYGSHIPATSYIGQPPEDKKFVALEVIILVNAAENVEIERKNVSDTAYTVVKYSKYKELYAAGLNDGRQYTGIFDKAKAAFETMSRILKKEAMNFADVVRQWNYIENITGIVSGEAGVKQNYQLFNDVRSIYYNTADFKNGYPAATGIGMIVGGVILDFIAVNASNPVFVVPIKNPRQVDAHQYSQDVLIGESIKKNFQKASPKFERAKTLTTKESGGQVYISGTAAILGQNTINEDVAGQTITTIENISKLISYNNLKNCGVRISRDIESLSYLRVYVKNEADIPEVKRICEKRFVNVPALYLVSDICRDDLLVEIEGEAEFQ